MIVYLNELSFESSKGLVADWEKADAFLTFVDQLLATSNVTIHASKNLWELPFGGFNLMKNENQDGSPIPSKFSKRLLELYKKMIPDADGDSLFSLHADMSKPSAAVGLAIIRDCPVVSVLFDEKFKTDIIQGWLQQTGMAPEVSSVNNLHDQTSGKAFIYLADTSACLTKDPLKEPMWNHALAERILLNVDFVALSPTERMNQLIYYGDLIASVNGWTKDHRISCLNSTREHKRCIYASATHFTSYRTAYISIDLESPIVSFELCDKKGKHKGEFNWKGEKIKEARTDHDIVV